MAKIEVAATDSEVVARLCLLLRETEQNEFSTTAALGLCTSIFAWVAQRVRRDEPLANALADRWRAESAGDDPWRLPPPLGAESVFDALVRLRRATSHADGNRVRPQNDPHCLTGFIMDADQQAPATLNEHELRRFGVQIAEQFSDHMRNRDAQ